MQERRNVGKKRYRKGVSSKRRKQENKECRKVGIQERSKQERRQQDRRNGGDNTDERCGKGGMQERRDTGKEEAGK